MSPAVTPTAANERRMHWEQAWDLAQRPREVAKALVVKRLIAAIERSANDIPEADFVLLTEAIEHYGQLFEGQNCDGGMLVACLLNLCAAADPAGTEGR